MREYHVMASLKGKITIEISCVCKLSLVNPGRLLGGRYPRFVMLKVIAWKETLIS